MQDIINGYIYFIIMCNIWIAGSCHVFVITSVGLKPKIPKEPPLLYFSTENFEQSRFQTFRFIYESFRFHLIWSGNGTELHVVQK